MRRIRTSPHGPRVAMAAFTLVECLAALTILILIMGVIFSIVSQTGSIWKSTSDRNTVFQEARAAFESVTRTLSQATLNTYYGYDDPDNPTTYVRQSELHFICGPASALVTSGTSWSGEAAPVRPTHAIFFQSPLGFNVPNSPASLNRLLNAVGYYIEFNSNKPACPAFLRNRPGFTPRYRYRLMQISQPAADLLVYDPDYAASKGWPAYDGWFNRPIASGQVRVVAENVVALIIQPKLSTADPGSLAPEYQGSLAPEYRYDSRFNPASASTFYGAATPAATRLLHSNQLPPIVQVTMVVIDESSAALLAAKNGAQAPGLVDTGAFSLESQFSSGDMDSPGDLERLEQSLIQKKIRFKVFSSNVTLLGAKWSNTPP